MNASRRGLALVAVSLLLSCDALADDSCLLLAIRAGREPERRERVIDDAWFVAKFMGQPAGYIHSIIKKTTRDGRTVVYEWTRIVRKTVVRGGELKGEETAQAWSTTDGELIRIVSTQANGPQREDLAVEREGNALKVVHRLNDTESRKTIEIPDGTKVSVGMQGWLLVKLGMGTGKKYALDVFSEVSKKLAVETTIVEGRRTVKHEEKDCDAFVVKSSVSDMPGITVEMLLTPDGKVLSIKALTFEFVRSTKEEALAGAEGKGPELDPLVKLTGGIPVVEALESVALVVEVAGDTDGKIISSNEYQRVKASPGRYEVELVARPAPKKAKDTLPVRPVGKELERYIKPAIYIQSDHAEIKAAADEALDGEKEPVAAVRKLCGWVYGKLVKESPKTGMASALETLRSGTGDCSEHAALFCALARAAGIPSREAFGIAVTWPAAGYHAWSEVMIDGKWVVVDASNNGIGAPPAYLLLGHSDGSHDDVSDSTTSFARLFANSKCTVTSAVRRGTKFDPRDSKTFHFVKGDTYYNTLFDLTIDLAGGWRVPRHGPQAVQAIGPNTVVLVVSAVVGSIPSEREWKKLAQGFKAASGATSFNRLEDTKLAGLPARAYSFVVSRGKVSLDGRMRVASSGSNVYTVVVMGAKAFKFTDEALGEPFDRVKLGPPKK